MNVRTKLLTAAILSVLASAGAHAQVLGGNAGLGGSLAGGLHNSGAMTHGAANGAFGANVDAESLRQRTRDAAGNTTSRVRGTTDRVRSRAHTQVHDVRSRTDSVAASAAANASGAASTTAGTTAVAAGSASSAASANGARASGALQGAAASEIAGPQIERPAIGRPHLNEVRSQATGSMVNSVAADVPSTSSEGSASADSANIGGVVSGNAAHSVDAVPRASAVGEGSAAGSGTVSRDGASVQSEVAGQDSAEVATN